MLSWLQLKKKLSFFFFPKEVAFSVVSGYFAIWLFSSSDTDFDTNIAVSCVKKTLLASVVWIQPEVTYLAEQLREERNVRNA